jgi:hypothetical protein
MWTFNGLFGDEQSLRDFTVSISVSDLTQHLDLAFRERFITQVLEQLRSDLRRDSFLAGVNLANHVQQFRRRHVLQQITARTRL